MSDAFNQMLAQGVTPIKFADPVNQMAQLMQLKNAQQTGVVNQMAIDKGQRQQADQAAYRNMLAQPGFNSTDPATQAQMYGLGFGADAADMATAKAAQQTAARETETRTLAAEGRAMDGYKARFPFDGTLDEMRAFHTMAISSVPEIASAMARGPGGLAGANASFEQVINNPAALQRFRDSILGESETTRANLAKLRAQELKALRPDAPTAPVKKDRENVGGVPFTVNPDGTFEAVIDPRTGKGFERVPTATEQKAKIAEENKKRGLSEAISNLDVLLGTEATDTTPAVPGVLDVATSSGVGARADAAVNFLGLDENKGQIAAGKAAVLADAILKIIPRFEGPQSNLDTASYNLAAGQLNNPNVGRKTKIEAAKTLRKMFKERAGQFTTQEEMDAGGSTPSPAGVAPAAEDIAHTAKIHGVSEDEVKRRMGLQ
jgi:hypothetical protein